MTIKFSFGKCKTKAAFKARLEQKGKLNLEKIKKKYQVILETPILLVVKIGDVEVIVHGYGELLFKRCDDAHKAEKIAEEIFLAGLSE